MNKFSDEDVVAFIDGQMDAQAKSAFAKQAKVEPALAQCVTAHQWMARQIVAAYGQPPTNALSKAQIAQLGLERDNIFKLKARMSSLPAASIPGTWTRLAAGITAIAASLAIGFVGARTSYTPDTDILTQRDSQVFATGKLAHALSSKASGEKGQIEISMTFRTVDGVCRSFEVKPRLSGIGCQDGGHWSIPVMAESRLNQSTGRDYQLASGDISPTVMAEVDRRIVGVPLTLEQEQKVLGSGGR